MISPLDRALEDFDRVPRRPLAVLPTPLQSAPQLARALGLDRELWVKRDDLTGPGLGGNKVRKLEYLLADAARAEADVVVTVGAAQSNHARLTAILGRVCGFEVHLVLGSGQPLAWEGNLLLDRLAGAHVHTVDSGDHDRLDQALHLVGAELAQAGRRPYLIPLGGSSDIGAMGYVRAYLELLTQIRSEGIQVDWIVHASGSGGTHAGLLAGRRIAGGGPRIFGVDIAKRGGEMREHVHELANRVLARFDSSLEVGQSDVLTADFAGPGYGVVTEEAARTIAMAIQTEGLVTDPVYSAKALAAIPHLCRGGELDGDGAIVFVHTGGHPALLTQSLASEVLRWTEQ